MNDYAQHPDYLALIAGICDDPAADLPRLVLADYLDERGDKASAARSEMIRLQCEWAKLVAGDPDAGRIVWGSARCPNCRALVAPHHVGPTPRCRGLPCRLLRRERDLLARWRIDWDREVLAVPHAARQERFVRNAEDSPPTFSRVGLTAREIAVMVTADMAARARPSPDAWLFDRRALHYSRGFVSRLTLPAAAFAEYAGALFSAAPIESVCLSDLSPSSCFGGWHYAPTPDGFAVGVRFNETTYLIPAGLWSPELAGPFRGATAAFAALERRAVAYGREAAEALALAPAQ